MVPVKPGDYVMVRIFPKKHSILEPRFPGPFQVESVKANGKNLRIKADDGQIIVRNVCDIKKVENYSKSPKEKYVAKYEDDSAIVNDDQKKRKEELQLNRYPLRSHMQPNRFMNESF